MAAKPSPISEFKRAISPIPEIIEEARRDSDALNRDVTSDGVVLVPIFRRRDQPASPPPPFLRTAAPSRTPSTSRSAPLRPGLRFAILPTARYLL